MPLRDSMSHWSGRIDAEEGEAGRRWHQVVRTVAEADRPGVALAGFACDAGVLRNRGRPGAAEGPRALRRMLAGLAWHGGPQARLYDAGDIDCPAEDLESAQQEYAARIAELLAAGHFPVGLGGGHEIAFASYLGAASAPAERARISRLGIVNFDAHLDLRPVDAQGRGSSGSPFLQIARSRAAAGLEFRYLCIGASEPANTPALLARAAELGTGIIQDVDASDPGTVERIHEFVEQSSAIYLTFCLDVLPPAEAPGVSAPATLGVALNRAITLLRELLASCAHGTPGSKLLLADVAELNPCHDPDGRTARAAARIVYEIVSFACSPRTR
ncbi:MAG TPA: formimidoylglutamase [Steroidobacteraceae bacterium]|nr:formimidoylglutamase [Steroidobacteraceae bacterium]